MTNLDVRSVGTIQSPEHERETLTVNARSVRHCMQMSIYIHTRLKCHSSCQSRQESCDFAVYGLKSEIEMAKVSFQVITFGHGHNKQTNKRYFRLLRNMFRQFIVTFRL